MEWRIFNIENVHLGDKTHIDDHILCINLEEIRSVILEDSRLKDAKIELVRPGERTRVINVVDVIEPRIKVDAEKSYFPGLVGKLKPAGDGATNILRGVGVIIATPLKISWDAVIDMAGEGSNYSPFSQLCHIVIIPTFSDHLETGEDVKAITMAGLKASVYLAKATIGLKHDMTEVYNLSLTTPLPKKNLPKVVYVYQIYYRRSGHRHYGNIMGNTYYGSMPGIDPIIMHPNEVIDGAIINGNHHMPSCAKNETYFIQNHPVIMQLYKEHGKTCNFSGVIIFNEDDSYFDLKERSAILTAHLAKSIIGAQGAIVTMTGEGHPTVSLMLTCEKLEEEGIKTTLITDEEGQADGSGNPLVTISPRADAIISTGNNRELVTLSSAERVVGGESFRVLKEKATDKVVLPLNMIPGANSQIGGNYLKARSY